MQNFQALGAGDSAAIGLRRLGTPSQDPQNSPPLRISGYAPANSYLILQITEVSMESLAFGSLSITLLGLVLTLRKRSKSVTSASVRIKERTVVHINFVVALTALHLTNLINEVIYMEDLLCKLTVVFRLVQ